ncbi:hypothetical protein DIPPA_23745 [Diplonema papillatum]|nr:hypothetical protein DIPPA_23745 [Diplonema papillatum]
MSGTTELTVVKRLHDLSGDVANQPYIARRGILPTLKKFMSNKNPEVQLTAVKTLRLLASHPDNPEFLVQEQGLLATVQSTYDTAPDGVLKTELDAVLEHLRPVASATPAAEPEAPAAPSASTSSDSKNYPSVAPKHKRDVAPRAKAERQKAVRRHMVLRADAINASNVDDLEHLLQYIRGMISYSIDTQNKTLTLFLSTPKHILLKHLADVGFTCEILEEAVVKATGGLTGHMPSYLSSGEQHESDYKRSLVLTGGGVTDHGSGSLAARLERQHKARSKADEEKSTVGGFFSGLARTLLS